MATIDVGAAAIDRATSSSREHTYITTENPANADGKLTQIQVYLKGAVIDLIVFTAYQGAADVFSVRDYQDFGALAAGLQTLACDIDIEAGDYIGWLDKTNDVSVGIMEADVSGDGYWYKAKAGGQGAVPFTDVVFTFVTNRSQSLYGTGVIFPEVTTNPASPVQSRTTRLHGTLDYDAEEACDCGFEYGLTNAYGTTTPTQSKETGETFVQGITLLTSETEYHFRTIATNSDATSYGSDVTFTTKAPFLGNINIDQLIYQHAERIKI